MYLANPAHTYLNLTCHGRAVFTLSIRALDPGFNSTRARGKRTLTNLHTNPSISASIYIGRYLCPHRYHPDPPFQHQSAPAPARSSARIRPVRPPPRHTQRTVQSLGPDDRLQHETTEGAACACTGGPSATCCRKRDGGQHGALGLRGGGGDLEGAERSRWPWDTTVSGRQWVRGVKLRKVP